MKMMLNNYYTKKPDVEPLNELFLFQYKSTIKKKNALDILYND